MKKLAEIFTMLTAVLAMIVVPPLGGMTVYGLWLQVPLSFDVQIPALLAGVWTAVVIAAIIRRGFE